MARPKEFEPDEALERAMHTFWAHGYHDTSIRDLVRSTGVNQYGLYSTFQDKHGLFLAALDRYRDTVSSALLRELRQDGAGLAEIRQVFELAIENTRNANGHSGCLMCITAVELAPYDKQASDKVTRHMEQLSKAFRGALESARQEGQISGKGDIQTLAEFLTATVYGVAMLMRAGKSVAYARRHVQTAMGCLG